MCPPVIAGELMPPVSTGALMRVTGKLACEVALRRINETKRHTLTDERNRKGEVAVVCPRG